WEALETADDKEFCSAPDLGVIRVKHLRSGLARGVLRKTEEGIVFARIPGHGVCQNCAAVRGTVCTHCRCATCTWEREADEHGGPRATKAQVDALRERLRTFQVGRQAREEVKF